METTISKLFLEGSHILEPLSQFGLDDQDYSTITSRLPDSRVIGVTRIHEGALNILLQNRTSNMIVQLVGDPMDYIIGASPITRIQ